MFLKAFRIAHIHHRLIGAGVADAVLSSLATLSAGLFAARLLSPSELGAYALLMAALSLAVVIPAQLVFVPSEAFAMSCTSGDRLRLFHRSIRVGLPISVVVACVMLPFGAKFTDEEAHNALIALTSTGAVAAMLWPIQDHIRRTLHLAGASTFAAIVSAVHLFGVLTSLVAIRYLGLPVAIGPFGSLALGNAISLIAGLGLAKQRGGAGSQVNLPRFRVLWLSGRWLVLGQVFPMTAGLVASALVTALAGGDILGYAEAARIVAQPLVVLSLGVSAILRPRLMAAAAARDAPRARRLSSLFTLLILSVAGLYLLMVAIPWSWSPFARIVPKAYIVGGMVAAMVLSNGAIAIAMPLRFELIGGKREVVIPKVELLGNLLRSGLAGTAQLTQAFAIPLGWMALAIVRLIGYRISVRRLYLREDADAS